MSRPFLISMRLSAPIALGEGHKAPLIMLDGLLAYCVACETFGAGAGRRDLLDGREIVDLPLPLDEALPGVYAASQGYAQRGHTAMTMIVKRHDQNDKVHMKTGKVWDAGKGPPSTFANAVVSLAVVHTPEVVFFGRGDLDEALRLLRRHISFLGHKRAAGYGHVTEIAGCYTDEDWSWSRVDEQGRLHLHRPVPASMDLGPTIAELYGADVSRRWLDEERAQATLAWKPPYYLPENQVLCYEPDIYGLFNKTPLIAESVQGEDDKDDLIPPDDDEEEEQWL